MSVTLGAGAEFTEERAFPRVQYPSHRRPYLLWGEEICELVDCAERGVRFGGALELPQQGDEIQARIRFRGGAEVWVLGTVVRVRDGEVALSLHPGHGIPAAVIAAEEAALRTERPG